MLNDIYQSIDPVLFAFGPFTVRWYGVAYVLGFVFAGLVIWRVARRWRVRVDADSLLTIMFCVIIGVIVGGRLGYVLFYGEGYYFQHPEQILAFNKGGMSFHGGLIGALLAGIAAAKLTRIPYLTLADLGCIGAPLGLLFGRCANFINGELWGAPPGAWCSEAPRARCRAIRRSFTRPFSRASSSSPCCICCRDACRRVRAARFWARSSSCTDASASSSSLCASPTRSWAIYGVAGLPWGSCYRCR